MFNFNKSNYIITIINTDNCLIVLFINGSILQEKFDIWMKDQLNFVKNHKFNASANKTHISVKLSIDMYKLVVEFTRLITKNERILRIIPIITSTGRQ